MASKSETRQRGARRASEYVNGVDHSEDKASAPAGQAEKPLISRFGTRHSAAILVNWSEGARRALGIRPADDGGSP